MQSQMEGHGGGGDSFFRGVALVAGLAVLAILALIAWSTTKEAWPAFAEEGISFVTSDVWNPPAGEFGALTFIYGTLLSSFIALLFAVPVSIASRCSPTRPPPVGSASRSPT
jgi:phosphate transport system permease protein